MSQIEQERTTTDKFKVWIAYGEHPDCLNEYEFETSTELNAFLKGVDEMITMHSELLDFALHEQLNTPEEVERWKQWLQDGQEVIEE